MQPKAVKLVGLVLVVLGLLTAGYAQFVFDPTLSPLDVSGAIDTVSSSSSFSDQAAAIRDLSDRYHRTMAGERTINFGLLAEQQRLFFLDYFWR